MSQQSEQTAFQKLLERAVSRRTFVKGGAAFGLSAFASGTALTGCSKKSNASGFEFENLPANGLDKVSLPDGFSWHTVASLGDPLFTDADEFNPDDLLANQPRAFGENCDGLEVFIVDGKTIVAVNHEYLIPQDHYPLAKDETLSDPKMVNAVMDAIGVSVMEIQRNDSGWQIKKDSPYNRRISMKTRMEIKGPARGHAAMRTTADPKGEIALGTWANCGCGKTPWGTYLTCEENFDYFFKAPNKAMEQDENIKRYGIGRWNLGVDFFEVDERFDPNKHPNEVNRAGYIVEIDPSDPDSVPQKHTALGRFKHENAALVVNADGRVVVYMGDDERGEFLYRYVSNGKYQPEHGKRNAELLDDGILYVAKFGEANDQLSGEGQWLELSFGKNGLIPENGFTSQADICIRTRQAGSFLGATTMDRPEWLAAHPQRAEIYCALTNNSRRNLRKALSGEFMSTNGPNPREKNLYGQVLRWRAKDQDHTGENFEWDLFVLAGNPLVHGDSMYAGSEHINADNMFNSPDGLVFDAGGSLWIQTDGNYSNEGQYKGMGNNQMLVANPDTGEIKRFMVGPNGCEVTGAAWSEDQKTLFVSIQHPGAEKTISNFPDGGTSPARASFIAIEHSKRQVKMIARR